MTNNGFGADYANIKKGSAALFTNDKTKVTRDKENSFYFLRNSLLSEEVSFKVDFSTDGTQVFITALSSNILVKTETVPQKLLGRDIKTSFDPKETIFILFNNIIGCSLVMYISFFDEIIVGDNTIFFDESGNQPQPRKSKF